MWLVGMTEGKKVGKYEVDCTDEDNVTKKGVQAKGMGCGVLCEARQAAVH